MKDRVAIVWGLQNPFSPEWTALIIIEHNYYRRVRNWQRSHNNNFILIGPKHSKLGKHPDLNKVISQADHIHGYSSRIATNSTHMEEALYYNIKGASRVNTHQVMARGMRMYMRETRRIQNGEFEEAIETLAYL